MLRRTEIGLADEGIRLIHASAKSSDSTPDVGIFCTRAVTYEDEGFRLSRPLRARMLMQSILDAGDAPDIIHAFGDGAWWIANELGSLLKRPVILEVYSEHHATRLARHAPFAAASYRLERLGLAPSAWTAVARGAVFTCADPGLANRLVGRVPESNLWVLPWGVHVPPSPTAPSIDLNQRIVIAIHATHASEQDLAALFEGLAKLVREGSDILALLPSFAADNLPVWSLAERFGLRDRLVFNEDFERTRDPILQTAAFLAVPSAMGRIDSILLDAMAAGCIVIAKKDPAVTLLKDRITGRVLSRPDGQTWAKVIAAFLADRTAREAMVHAARNYVAEERTAAGYIASLIGMYDRVQAAYETAAKQKRANSKPDATNTTTTSTKTRTSATANQP